MIRDLTFDELERSAHRRRLVRLVLGVTTLSTILTAGVVREVRIYAAVSDVPSARPGALDSLRHRRAAVEGLLDKLVESKSPTVIKALEKRVEKLETEKLLLAEKQAKSGTPRRSFEEIFELAMEFLASPWNIYKNGPLSMKRLVLRLAFKGPIAYDRENGFRTPQVSDIFRIFEPRALECQMVPRRGLEPPRPYGH